MKKQTEIDQNIIALRRHLHKYPELSNQEKMTSETLARNLTEIGLDVKSGIGGYGVVGFLDSGRPGKNIAVRADMDALPITEKGEKEYGSVHPGVMHACGHDAHAAVVAGAARYLYSSVPELSGTVKFIFQPSEEKPPGGARRMIDEGVLNNPDVDAVLGLHNSTDTPVGEIIVLDGPVMAGSDYFTVKIIGRGGHGAMPEKTSDTILIASHFVVTLQNIINRKFAQADHPVVSIGKIEGGSAHNIIPREVTLTGTVRHFHPERGAMAQELESILKSLVVMFGGEYEFEYFPGYPMTYNDPKLCDLVRKTASENEGVTRVRDALSRAYVAEDFGYFSRAKPSCYFIFGGRNEAKGMVYPPHTAEFDLDDQFLPVVSRLIAETVINYLNQ